MSRAFLALTAPPWLVLGVRNIRRRIVLAWRGFASAERRTAWHLFSHGFLFRREPVFVTGRKPDFLTYGRGRMWVEAYTASIPVAGACTESNFGDHISREPTTLACALGQ